jgi:hypothetical protein
MKDYVSELVEAITAPFLVEDDTEIPSLDECIHAFNEMLSFSNEELINALPSKIGVSKDVIAGFLSSNPEAAQRLQKFMTDAPLPDKKSWKEKNVELANKMGYELIDYIGSDHENEDPTVVTKDPDSNGINQGLILGDEHTFRDSSGIYQEEFSHRDKIKHILRDRK